MGREIEKVMKLRLDKRHKWKLVRKYKYVSLHRCKVCGKRQIVSSFSRLLELDLRKIYLETAKARPLEYPFTIHPGIKRRRANLTWKRGIRV